MVTLADGTKVPPAPKYLSAKEMEAKGKNSYGVPPASFAFYPEKYFPNEEDVFGNNKKKRAEFVKAMGEANRTIPCPGFKPKNEPQWDRRDCDSVSLRYDCFSVERLFVVPWGNKDSEIGKIAGNETLFEPGLFVGPDGHITLVDEGTQSVKRFSRQGVFIEKAALNWLGDRALNYEEGNVSRADRQGFVLYGPTKLTNDIMVGVEFSYHEKSDGYWNIQAVDLNAHTVVCKIYGPPILDPSFKVAHSVIPFSTRNRPKVLPGGDIVSGVSTDAGFEIYLYKYRTK